MASRRTRFTVYVDEELMTKPDELVDAVMAHLIKKELDTAKRKQFLAGYMRECTDELRLKFIDTWVLVRDVATFPFRDNKKEGTDEDKEVPVMHRTPEGLEGTANIKFGKEQCADEDTEDSGGVSVDDGADGEPDTGTTPE